MACAAVQRLQARTFLALFGLRCVFGIILNPFNKIENQLGHFLAHWGLCDRARGLEFAPCIIVNSTNRSRR